SARPMPAKAPRTRSRLSATALSARPTTAKDGCWPPSSCTSTSTRRASTPSNATVTTRATLAASRSAGTGYAVIHRPARAGSDGEQTPNAEGWQPPGGGRLAPAPGLDHVPQGGGGVAGAEALHLLGAGGRGDVDLGEPVADHVDAHEQKAAALQLGA